MASTVSDVPALRSKATGSPRVGRDDHRFVLGLNEAHQTLPLKERTKVSGHATSIPIYPNLPEVPVYILSNISIMYISIYIYTGIHACIPMYIHKIYILSKRIYTNIHT